VFERSIFEFGGENATRGYKIIYVKVRIHIDIKYIESPSSTDAVFEKGIPSEHENVQNILAETEKRSIKSFSLPYEKACRLCCDDAFQYIITMC
jgi:hypothetical protein